MADKKNVIVGAARVFIGPDYEGGTGAPPAAVTETSFATTLAADVDWRDVGFTTDGVEISYEPDYGEVEVDQSLDTPRIFKTSMRVMLNTTFAEATFENLAVVWGQRDATITTTGTGTGKVDTLTLISGGLGEAPLERQLVAIGNGTEQVAVAAVTGPPAQAATPGGVYAERTYFGRRVLSTDTSAHSLRRNEATVFPVSFRLLPTDETNSPYGIIRERVRTW